MNQENKKQVIIAAVLGVVLVCVLVYQFLIAGGPAAPTQTASSRPATAAGSAPAAPATAATPARLRKVDVDLDKLIRNIEPVTFIYNNERITRNPMTPLVGRIFSASATDQPARTSIGIDFSIRQKKVTGIIYNEYNPVAVVDDELVTEGHQYPDGVIVFRIEPKRVWFEWRDSQIPVELKEL
ncbi:MAG: hypothetical protein KF886_11815 [Candidatus Hydrogenedentes bacterium]|nr:hypothetical protein [Candidatus Hydrogenedentota bacterium]